MSNKPHYLMQFFNFDHLPGHLQDVSCQFYDLAESLDATLPDNPEKTTALMNLLLSKDCAVRSVLFKYPEQEDK